jgi:hypothetical protein
MMRSIHAQGNPCSDFQGNRVRLALPLFCDLNDNDERKDKCDKQPDERTVIKKNYIAPSVIDGGGDLTDHKNSMIFKASTSVMKTVILDLNITKKNVEKMITSMLRGANKLCGVIPLNHRGIASCRNNHDQRA